MRLHELAHRIAWDVSQQVTRPEHRVVLLQYVLSGFDGDGQRIVHAPHQEQMLRCLDCPRHPTGCETCEEIQRAEKGNT